MPVATSLSQNTAECKPAGPSIDRKSWPVTTVVFWLRPLLVELSSSKHVRNVGDTLGASQNVLYGRTRDRLWAYFMQVSNHVDAEMLAVVGQEIVRFAFENLLGGSTQLRLSGIGIGNGEARLGTASHHLEFVTSEDVLFHLARALGCALGSAAGCLLYSNMDQSAFVASNFFRDEQSPVSCSFALKCNSTQRKTVVLHLLERCRRRVPD